MLEVYYVAAVERRKLYIAETVALQSHKRVNG